MYLLTPLILQNFKKILSADPELWRCVIFRLKMAHLSWKFFFLAQNIIITFIYLLAAFIVQNLKQFLQWIQSYEDVPFLGPKSSICPKQIFWKIINITFIYLLAPFIVKNFKKILPTDPELWGCKLLGPKWPNSPNENFFRKPVNELCFFHSKSDINILVKYWRLNNAEISLTESPFWL